MSICLIVISLIHKPAQNHKNHIVMREISDMNSESCTAYPYTFRSKCQIAMRYLCTYILVIFLVFWIHSLFKAF